MKMENGKLKIAIMAISIALIAMGGGCAICPKKDCPAQDVGYMIMTPFGPMPLKMEKGFLNPENKDKSWLTLEEMKKRMEGPREEEAPVEESGKGI